MSNCTIISFEFRLKINIKYYLSCAQFVTFIIYLAYIVHININVIFLKVTCDVIGIILLHKAFLYRSHQSQRSFMYEFLRH